MTHQFGSVIASRIGKMATQTSMVHFLICDRRNGIGLKASLRPMSDRRRWNQDALLAFWDTPEFNSRR
jgi:hypothetical protein